MVLQDELRARAVARSDRTNYLLTIIAAIFLPLGFVTGLLGINVGGIPGADAPHGFWLACLLIGGVATFQWWVFRRLRWL